MRWFIDGNNVFGSRPDGWWNNRSAAQARFADTVARWCSTHGHDVVIVFDPPLTSQTAQLAGGNLRIVEAPRRGRNAADDHIVDLVTDLIDVDSLDPQPVGAITVVTSDRGLRARLPGGIAIEGAGRFRERIGY